MLHWRPSLSDHILLRHDWPNGAAADIARVFRWDSVAVNTAATEGGSHWLGRLLSVTYGSRLGPDHKHMDMGIHFLFKLPKEGIDGIGIQIWR